MNVLLTGATGFVGSAVARALVRHGHHVLGLVRRRQAGQFLEALGGSLTEGDMWRPDTYGPLVAKVDAVIHAAQEKPQGRWNRRKIRAVHASDALMTRTLAAACLADKKPLLYSSGALAHRGVGDEWIDEDTPPRPCLLARGHADMVAELEGDWARRGLRTQIISPGFVYGPGGFLKETADMLRAGRYRIIGTGDNYWSLVHVDDLAEAYVLALERGAPGGHYFVADDLPLRRRDVIHRTSDALELPPVGHVPRWIVGLWLGFPLVEAINSPIRMRNSRLKQELGWLPRYTTFSEGLASALHGLSPI